MGGETPCWACDCAADGHLCTISWLAASRAMAQCLFTGNLNTVRLHFWLIKREPFLDLLREGQMWDMLIHQLDIHTRISLPCDTWGAVLRQAALTVGIRRKSWEAEPQYGHNFRDTEASFPFLSTLHLQCASPVCGQREDHGFRTSLFKSRGPEPVYIMRLLWDFWGLPSWPYLNW